MKLYCLNKLSTDGYHTLGKNNTEGTLFYSNTGWRSRRRAFLDSLMQSRSVRDDGFTSDLTLLQNTPPNPGIKNCFVTENSYKGYFDPGNWQFKFILQSYNHDNSGFGRIGYSLWKSKYSSGSNSTQLMFNKFGDNLSNGAMVFDNIYNLPSIRLDNEFLFISVMYRITQASSNYNCYVIFRFGEYQSFLNTPNFYPDIDIKSTTISDDSIEPSNISLYPQSLKITSGNIIDDSSINSSGISTGEVTITSDGFSSNEEPSNESELTFSQKETTWFLGDIIL